MGALPCLFTCREIFSLLEWKMTEYDGILIVACLPYVFLYGFKFLSSRKTYIKCAILAPRYNGFDVLR